MLPNVHVSCACVWMCVAHSRGGWVCRCTSKVGAVAMLCTPWGSFLFTRNALKSGALLCILLLLDASSEDVACTCTLPLNIGRAEGDVPPAWHMCTEPSHLTCSLVSLSPRMDTGHEWHGWHARHARYGPHGHAQPAQAQRRQLSDAGIQTGHRDCGRECQSMVCAGLRMHAVRWSTEAG